MKHIYKLFTLTILVALVTFPAHLNAHCQVPCGIYDDHMRLQGMLEDVATIEKALASMKDLAGQTDIQSHNQMVRWVITKEDHAQKIIETISDYYLTQRVKTSQEDYSIRLEKHHAVILLAMKAKQKADPKVASALKKSIKALAEYYPEHKH